MERSAFWLAGIVIFASVVLGVLRYARVIPEKRESGWSKAVLLICVILFLAVWLSLERR